MGSHAPTTRPLKILYHLHPDFDLLDFAGPFEVLAHASFTEYDTPSHIPVFESTITAVNEDTATNEHCTIKRHISIPEAYATLADYDILVIPGGGSPPVLENKTEPLGLIKAFADLPKREDGKTRTLLSVCTGSLFLAEAGVLDGLSATTHPTAYDRLRDISQKKGTTEVLEVRYVVNKVDEKKGLRIITSGGVSCGMDSCLWLVGDVAGGENRTKAAELIQYTWREEGVVL